MNNILYAGDEDETENSGSVSHDTEQIKDLNALTVKNVTKQEQSPAVDKCKKDISHTEHGGTTTMFEPEHKENKCYESEVCENSSDTEASDEKNQLEMVLVYLQIYYVIVFFAYPIKKYKSNAIVKHQFVHLFALVNFYELNIIISIVSYSGVALSVIACTKLICK